MKVLIPVDGSECSLRAVAHTIRTIDACGGGDGLDVHLLNVQAHLPGTVGIGLRGKDLEDYHREEGFKALAPARALLDQAGVACTPHIDVGRPAEVIDRYARELGIDQIVMGTRGLGNLADILLGSTSEDLLRLTRLPLLLVK